jgi:hypothetical protein
MAPMTLNIKRPVLVLVSRAWLPEIDRTLRETFLASSRATIASKSPTDRANHCPE